jgi:hypothetical protein
MLSFRGGVILKEFGSLAAILSNAFYYIRDFFTTDLPAGSLDGTAAEPGPGVRNSIDSGNNVVITGSELVSSGIVGANDPLFIYDPVDFKLGLTAKWEINWTSNRSGGGWVASAVPVGARANLGVGDNSGALYTYPPDIVEIVLSTATDYTIWATLHATGGAIWAQGGVFAVPTLLWVDDTVAWSDPVYFAPIIARVVACNITVDNVEVTLQQALSTPTQIAKVLIDNPPTGVGYAGVADALHYATISQAVLPGAGDVMEVRYRIAGPNDYWSAKIEYDGAQWDYKLNVVVAGVVTNKTTVLNVGNIDQIAVIADGNKHLIVTYNGAAWTERSSIVDATYATEEEVGVWYDSGSVTILKSFERDWVL